MNKVRTIFTSYPYITNVVGYTTLFSTADLIQQSMLGGEQGKSTQLSGCSLKPVASREVAVFEQSESTCLKDCECIKCSSKVNNASVLTRSTPLLNIDWGHTTRVALVGLCFHSNFNYHWLRALERMFPGGGAKGISIKVLLDQLIAAPATISAFYIGLSTLEGREDPFVDWKNKFWTSYKTGVVYWSIMQAVNFYLVPPVARTVFVGGISLGWTVFLCHFRHQRSDSHCSTST